MLRRSAAHVPGPCAIAGVFALTLFSLSQARTVAEILREAARREVLPRFRDASLRQPRQKTSRHDLVTDADEAAEEMIAAALGKEFPGAVIVGEEGSAKDPALLETLRDAEIAFLIDPIDGTKNFSSGLPLFGMMAA